MNEAIQSWSEICVFGSCVPPLARFGTSMTWRLKTWQTAACFRGGEEGGRQPCLFSCDVDNLTFSCLFPWTVEPTVCNARLVDSNTRRHVTVTL